MSKEGQQGDIPMENLIIAPQEDSQPETKVNNQTWYGKISEYVPCFQSYKELAEEFFLINNIQGNLRRSFLLTSLGTVSYEKLRTLVHPSKPTECTIDHIWEVLERYYSPKTHTLAQRFKFLKSTQQSGETVNEFVVRIKNLAEKCKFGDYIPQDLANTSSAELRNKALEDALRDKMIMGLSDARIQQSLLEKKERYKR